MSKAAIETVAPSEETALSPKALRVIVVTSDVPFVDGGHRVIAREITRALEAQGHLAELVQQPEVAQVHAVEHTYADHRTCFEAVAVLALQVKGGQGIEAFDDPHAAILMPPC